MHAEVYIMQFQIGLFFQLKSYNNDIRGDRVTTGEKLSLLRKNKGITQEELSEILKVSRQSVSRWEMDAAFPETDKLIKLSKLFECSIDYLLHDSIEKNNTIDTDFSIHHCYIFIRECGYFFLATSADNQPKLRPFGMIYTNDETLFIATDKRKKVYDDLKKNPKIEIASYNLNTHKWIRISGKAEIESSNQIKEEMMNIYPNLIQTYHNENEMYLVIYKLLINDISIT